MDLISWEEREDGYGKDAWARAWGQTYAGLRLVGVAELLQLGEIVVGGLGGVLVGHGGVLALAGLGAGAVRELVVMGR